VLKIGFIFVKRDFFVFGKGILRQLTDFFLEVVTESCLALRLLASHLIREIPDWLTFGHPQVKDFVYALTLIGSGE